jgi:hypothetical protein
MTDFEFYMAFYGLLLGLSAATLLGRLADVIGARHRLRIGWLSSLLALFVLLQMTGIWAWTWTMRTTLVVTWPSLFESAIVSSGFYLGAALVFPRDIDEWASLDEHYWQNKRITAVLVLLCAFVSTSHHVWNHRELLVNPAWLAWSSLYYVPMICLVVSKSKILDIGVLSILIAQLAVAGLGLI